MRGFSLDRLGTDATISPTGFPTGGNGLIVLNAELRVDGDRQLRRRRVHRRRQRLPARDRSRPRRAARRRRRSACATGRRSARSASIWASSSIAASCRPGGSSGAACCTFRWGRPFESSASPRARSGTERLSRASWRLVPRWRCARGGRRVAQQLLDRVVARVNGVAITLTDVKAAIALGIVERRREAAGDRAADRPAARAGRGGAVSAAGAAAAAIAVEAASADDARRRPAAARSMASTGIDEARIREIARDNLRIQAYLDQRFGVDVQLTEEEVAQDLPDPSRGVHARAALDAVHRGRAAGPRARQRRTARRRPSRSGCATCARRAAISFAPSSATRNTSSELNPAWLTTGAITLRRRR